METSTKENIVILGISDSPDRYSFMAYEMLLQNGFKSLYGVSPKTPTLPNIKIVKTLSEITVPVHTLTLYVSPQISNNQVEEILKLAPTRIIMNPGTENSNLANLAKSKNIEVIMACTLVMLRTNQF